MDALYSSSFLNVTLSRWLRAAGPRPAVDCITCAKPLKCCDFQPFVANFLLGKIIEENGGLPELDSKKAIYLPIGAVATTGFRARHAATPERLRKNDLACGFYDLEKRSCKIWQDRPGECSTYFCDDGAAAVARTGFSQQSFEIEVAVAQMALLNVGFTNEEIGAQVDAINGEVHNLPVTDVNEVFLECWKWSRTLSETEIRGWLK